MASSSTELRRLAAFSRSLERLREVLAVEPSPIARDAAIQRFEFCFELAWKAVRELLRREGLGCPSPWGCLREAFRRGWIADEAAALQMLDDRNLTSHTYDERLAAVVYGRLPAHLRLLEGLEARLRETATAC
jgi:nucleotidyltransferase substrate binding protein (TIGR01987 family)